MLILSLCYRLATRDQRLTFLHAERCILFNQKRSRLRATRIFPVASSRRPRRSRRRRRSRNQKTCCCCLLLGYFLFRMPSTYLLYGSSSRPPEATASRAYRQRHAMESHRQNPQTKKEYLSILGIAFGRLPQLFSVLFLLLRPSACPVGSAIFSIYFAS
jgi:hypothetical protein